MILHIDSSTEVCSVVLTDQMQVLASRTSSKRDHANILSVFIDEVCKESNVAPSRLKAVAVCSGPGSYTGLRIGVATAKGLCYSLKIPLIAVNAMLLMANHFLNEYDHDSSELLVPMIDARRMEVYGAVLDNNLNFLVPTKAEILSSNSFIVNSNAKYVCFGSGAIKCDQIYAENNAIRIVTNFLPHAKGMIKIAYDKFLNNEFEDVAYFEPFYLKEFVGIK